MFRTAAVEQELVVEMGSFVTFIGILHIDSEVLPVCLSRISFEIHSIIIIKK